MWLESSAALLGIFFPLSFLGASLFILYLIFYWLRFGMNHFLDILPPLLELFFQLVVIFGAVSLCLVLAMLVFHHFKKQDLPFESWFLWCKEHILILLFFMGCAYFLTGSLGVIHAELIIWDPKKNRCLIKVGGMILERKVQYLGTCGEVSYFFDRTSTSKVMAVKKSEIGFLRYL